MEHWGYIAIFFASLMEGETALITGSFMAHRGYFVLPKVIMVSLAATLIIDWSYFVIGRKHGRKFLQTRPRLEAKLNHVTTWIEKYPVLLMIFYRFLYGIRIPLTIAFGLSTYSALRFGMLSFVGILLWVGCYVFVGYFFGAIIEANLTMIKHYELAVAGIILLTSLGVFYFVKKRNLKKLDEVGSADGVQKTDEN
ncbi:MAG: DedA family protein [Flammeovirgaceae bacterium]|nr:DedA family protein [Flammeovirgaceae bacterium]